MVPGTGNKGLFYWEHNVHKAFLALATDDIIIAVTDKSLYRILRATFNNYFAYTYYSARSAHTVNAHNLSARKNIII